MHTIRADAAANPLASNCPLSASQFDAATARFWPITAGPLATGITSDPARPSLMKDANNRDAVVGDAEINHMPFDIAAAIARSNMITRRSGLRCFGQDLECRGQQVGVSLRLI